MRYIILLTFLILTLNAKSQQTVGLFFNQPESFNGYTLFSSLLADTTYLINNCGEKIHSWAAETRPGMVAYLKDNGNLLRTSQTLSDVFSGGGIGGKVQEFAWNNDLIWNYEFADSLKHQHHDIELLPNGNVLILSWEFHTAADAINRGRDSVLVGESFWPTLITEVQPLYPNGGIVVWEWRAFDHLIQDFDELKLNFGVVSEHPELIDINYTESSNPDWLHCNAINYNPTLDQIVLSSRHSSEIYIIDHSTTTTEAASHAGGNQGMGGDILYRWGNPSNYDRGTELDRTLFFPHDIHWIPDSLEHGGELIIFNNGGGSDGSSVDRFAPTIDQNGGYPINSQLAFEPVSANWHFEQQDFFSGHTSGAQVLPNGNVLICEGTTGRIFELNELDSTVWEYINPAGGFGIIAQGNPTSSQNSLFRAYRYPVDFPAFNGRDLTPAGPIELLALPSNCEITLEPVNPEDTTNAIEVLDPFNIQVSTLVSEKIRIEMLDSHDNVTANFYNSTGQLLKSEQVKLGVHQTNISGWSNGIYLVIISSPTEKNQVLRKIIKQ